MLIGIDKSTGNRVMAVKDNADAINRLTKDKMLVCPECESILTFKNGDIKLPHFSHKTKCPYPYWEPESEEHIQGKLAVIHRLENLYPNSKVYLEYSVSETNQRSDVMLIHPNGEKWAFEIQLSKILLSTLIERHELYKTAGVFDFWLLGAKAYEVLNLSVKDKGAKNAIDICRVSWLISFIYEENNTNKDDLVLIEGVDKPFTILASKSSKKTINIKCLIISIDKDSREKRYEFKDQVNYKRAYENYKLSKQAIKTHFENQYTKAKVYMDYKIQGSNEKADILIESEKGGSCAINIIVAHFQYRKNEDRVKIYSDNNITVFWLYAVLKHNKGRGLSHDAVIPNSYKYYLAQDNTGKWVIYHYIESMRTGVIKLDNVIFKFNDNNQIYYLEDKSAINIRKPILQSIEKEIKWIKGKGGLAGFVYCCPKIGHDTTVFNAQMLSNCDKCIGFKGYIKEGNKKVRLYCSIL